MQGLRLGAALDQTPWHPTAELTCCLLRNVERNIDAERPKYPILRPLLPPAEPAAAHLHLDRKKLVQGGQCEPVARSARDAAHRVSDSIELNNPRGSGEGHGRTFSPEGSEDELLQAWFHGGRHKGVVSGYSLPILINPWFPRFPRGKGATPIVLTLVWCPGEALHGCGRGHTAHVRCGHDS